MGLVQCASDTGYSILDGPARNSTKLTFLKLIGEYVPKVVGYDPGEEFCIKL